MSYTGTKVRLFSFSRWKREKFFVFCGMGFSSFSSLSSFSSGVFREEKDSGLRDLRLRDDALGRWFCEQSWAGGFFRKENFGVSILGKSVSTASNNYRVLCQRGFNFEKSVDTWLTRQGEFGERKIPNSLIFRVRDFSYACPEQESNLHTSRYTHLKRTRLPIPPSGLGDCAQDKSRTCMP